MRSAAALAATLAVLLAVLLGASCDYLEHWRRQNDYERRQRSDPSQQNLKHMLEQPNFGVIGRTEVAAAAGAAADDAAGAPVAIAAFSSRFRPHELVGVAHDVGWGSHFGLDLPAGEFDVLALADRDGDGVYRDDEVIARERLELSPASFPSKVVTGFVLDLAAAAERVDWPVAIEVERAEARTSLFYPTGTIRDLADPIFDAETVTLGCYDPAAFFERAPTMFYALEDDLAFKIPVVFVHGFGGSAREFAPLVERLDRDRFKPWFFHYPSGADLDQLATLFYGIFLSGEAVQASAVVPLVIVAHSMGGLVVRRALGMLRGGAGEQAHVVFCSLATPFGGHPSAAGVGDSSVLVLPSWRDLDPGSEFLAGLCREPLPPAVEHWLFYAFDNDAFLKFGENSDGVVPLASQLRPEAQRQAHRQFGLAASHTGLLRDPAALDAILAALDGLEVDAPPAQLAAFRAGGFAVAGEGYTELERYFLLHYGRLLEGLASGAIEPALPGQRELVPMLRGESEAGHPAATAWRKYVAR